MAKEKEESTARYEMQLTTLNENLSTLRLDAATTMERLKELEKSNSEYLAQKLGKEFVCLMRYIYHLLFRTLMHCYTFVLLVMILVWQHWIIPAHHQHTALKV